MTNPLSKYTDDELFTIFGEVIKDELESRGYEWRRKDEYAGVIYIMVNPAFPNLVKIGYADDVEKRLLSLNSKTGLPDPYGVYAVYKVKKRLADLRLFQLIDSLDPDLRHADDREFYEMTPERAYDILNAIAEVNGNETQLVKNPLSDVFFESGEDIVQTTDQTNKSGAVVPSGVYHAMRMTKKFGIEYEATMRVLDDAFIVQQGSSASMFEGVTLSKRIKFLRHHHLDKEGFVTQDVEFTSVASAASFITGKDSDGWFVWKTEDGQYIDVFRHQ